MADTGNNSPLFTVNERQWVKGLVLAVIGAFLGGIQGIVSTGHLPSTLAELQPIGIGALSAGIAYVAHSFASNEQGQLGK